MGANIEKIQSTISQEIDNALLAEKKRIQALIKEANNLLTTAIKEGWTTLNEIEEEDDEPVDEVEKEWGKDEEEPEDGEAEAALINEGEFDLALVSDDEAQAHELYKEKVSTLKAQAKERNLVIPKSYNKLQIVKLLILVHEEEAYNEGAEAE